MTDSKQPEISQEAAREMLAALKDCEPYIAHFKGGWSTHTHGEMSTDELLETVQAAISRALNTKVG